MEVGSEARGDRPESWLRSSPGERMQLRQLVLVTGSFRTMAAYIQAFERFERWVSHQELDMYPLSIDKALKYGLFLDSTECGPSVLPSFRTAVRWVCSRLAIDPPDLDDKRWEALQSKVVAERARTLKEAVPIPIAAVKALELWLVHDASEPKEGTIFIWWLLCSIFASLRFDDAIHVKPSEG